MSACERCWSDANRDAEFNGCDIVGRYHELVSERECTPEDQAGPDATWCRLCERMTRHQITQQCMACGAPQ